MSGSDTTTSLRRHIIMFWLQAVMSQWRWPRGGREQAKTRGKRELSRTWTGANVLQMEMTKLSLRKPVWVMAVLNWNKSYTYTSSCLRIQASIHVRVHEYACLLRTGEEVCGSPCVVSWDESVCGGPMQGTKHRIWLAGKPKTGHVISLLLQPSPNTTHLPAEPSWIPYPYILYNMFQEWFLPLINKDCTRLPRCLYFSKSIARYEREKESALQMSHGSSPGFREPDDGDVERGALFHRSPCVYGSCLWHDDEFSV